ncbi:MAG: hypothetical protein J0M04_19075 [Verrucomicrobia bacterium]|nr:hypothetical protein [Verrucomicrobiota bacterium]MBN8459936.1 hypothetical protein [Verrucomicrobiota bacterium]
MKTTAKFLLVLAVLTAMCAIIWEFTLPGGVYDCTDEVGFDYLSPGDWVHGPIEYVEKIDTMRGMELPDTLKRGWTITGLWGIWWFMFGSSIIIAGFASRISWGAVAGTSQDRNHTDTEPPNKPWDATGDNVRS